MNQQRPSSPKTARPLTADELQMRFNLRRVRSLLNLSALPSKLALVKSNLKLKSNNKGGSKTPVASLFSPSESSINDSKTNLKLKLMLNEPDVFNCLWQYWCLLADCDMLALDDSGHLCCMHQQWCLLHRLLIQCLMGERIVDSEAIAMAQADWERIVAQYGRPFCTPRHHYSQAALKYFGFLPLENEHDIQLDSRSVCFNELGFRCSLLSLILEWTDVTKVKEAPDLAFCLRTLLDAISFINNKKIFRQKNNPSMRHILDENIIKERNATFWSESVASSTNFQEDLKDQRAFGQSLLPLLLNASSPILSNPRPISPEYTDPSMKRLQSTSREMRLEDDASLDGVSTLLGAGMEGLIDLDHSASTQAPTSLLCLEPVAHGRQLVDDNKRDNIQANHTSPASNDIAVGINVDSEDEQSMAGCSYGSFDNSDQDNDSLSCGSLSRDEMFDANNNPIHTPIEAEMNTTFLFPQRCRRDKGYGYGNFVASQSSKGKQHTRSVDKFDRYAQEAHFLSTPKGLPKNTVAARSDLRLQGGVDNGHSHFHKRLRRHQHTRKKAGSENRSAKGKRRIPRPRSSLTKLSPPAHRIIAEWSSLSTESRGIKESDGRAQAQLSRRSFANSIARLMADENNFIESLPRQQQQANTTDGIIDSNVSQGLEVSFTEQELQRRSGVFHSQLPECRHQAQTDMNNEIRMRRNKKEITPQREMRLKNVILDSKVLLENGSKATGMSPCFAHAKICPLSEFSTASVYVPPSPERLTKAGRWVDTQMEDASPLQHTTRFRGANDERAADRCAGRLGSHRLLRSALHRAGTPRELSIPRLGLFARNNGMMLIGSPASLWTSIVSLRHRPQKKQATLFFKGV